MPLILRPSIQALTDILSPVLRAIIELPPLAISRSAVATEIMRVRRKLAAATASVTLKAHLHNDALTLIDGECARRSAPIDCRELRRTQLDAFERLGEARA
jgi:hypothetical protein